MKIIVASVSGMCFGVRDALETLTRVDRPQSVAIYGELVHNDVVLHQLDTRGFQRISETQRNDVPDAPNVVITAHGISDKRRQQLTEAGKNLIDTTCPLVTRVHRAAQDFARSGAFVVVIGKPHHVEVEGITGDLEDFAVVSSEAEVGTYYQTQDRNSVVCSQTSKTQSITEQSEIGLPPSELLEQDRQPAENIGIVCQTTFPCHEAAAIRRRIEHSNPKARIQWADTICQPTKDRQQALTELLDQVDAVVVVGGRQSHNTLRLIDRCHQYGLTTFHVEGPEELEAHWFESFETVGLTAGTSTLPETIQSVHDRLVMMSQQSRSSHTVLS